mgnify:FL=1
MLFRSNINVWELIRLANRHPRVNILQPGPGVGGHCIAVDPWFIVSKTPDEARIIRAAREVNDSKPLWVLDQVGYAIDKHLQENLSKTSKEVTIACFGLAFKPDIDDLRESPALEIALKISKSHQGTLLVVEPNIEKLPSSLEGLATLCSTEIAMSQANVIVMLVDHKVFKAIPKNRFSTQELIDTRGVWA